MYGSHCRQLTTGTQRAVGERQVVQRHTHMRSQPLGSVCTPTHKYTHRATGANCCTSRKNSLHTTPERTFYGDRLPRNIGLCDGFVLGEARGLSRAKPLSTQRLHDTNEERKQNRVRINLVTHRYRPVRNSTTNKQSHSSVSSGSERYLDT